MLKTKLGVCVHFESDQIIYSPSDLTLYMESPFASLMEHLACIEPCTLDLVDKEDPLLSVLQHKGLQFEQEILASFRSPVNLTESSFPINFDNQVKSYRLYVLSWHDHGQPICLILTLMVIYLNINFFDTITHRANSMTYCNQKG